MSIKSCYCQFPNSLPINPALKRKAFPVKAMPLHIMPVPCIDAITHGIISLSRCIPCDYLVLLRRQLLIIIISHYKCKLQGSLQIFLPKTTYISTKTSLPNQVPILPFRIALSPTQNHIQIRKNTGKQSGTRTSRINPSFHTQTSLLDLKFLEDTSVPSTASEH